ncbi:MAG: chorismate lyase [Mariprofundaceae bacterium]|nr:chorismate lyase [Mariprofundaceae bacterium]
MFANQWKNEDWRLVRDWLAEGGCKQQKLKAILTVTTALTNFLNRQFGMPLSVQLHDQFMDKISADEAELLHCQAGNYALRRQVSLCYQGVVMFDAESVLPLHDLPQSLVEALEAGIKPLASLLAERGLSLARSDLSIIQLDDGRWGRRSVLRSSVGTQALVVEIFKPEFWQEIQRLEGQR